VSEKLFKDNKILFISSEFPPGPGGLGEHAFQISRGLNELGWEVTVITTLDYTNEIERDEFIEQLNYQVINIKRNSWSIINVCNKILKIILLTKQLNPTIIISSGSISALYGRILEKIFQIKRVSFVHGPEFRMIYNDYITRWILNTSRIIAVSNWTSEFIKKSGVSSPIDVIMNGADITKYNKPSINGELKNILGINDKFVLLTVGRICDRKGQETVIKAIKILNSIYSEIVYIMVGYETDKEKYSNLILELDLSDQVISIGQVSSEELPSYYALADIYILNSRPASDGDIEGFGISILEAAMMSKPAIGSKDCGIEDAIVKDETGLLVQPDSPMETANAIKKLIDNEELRLWMGENSRERALNYFTWERVVTDVDQLLKQEL
jgi:glycosyltransferase involved in cell wall biosynthesis